MPQSPVDLQLIQCSWLSFIASSVLPVNVCFHWELLIGVCCTVTLYFAIHIGQKKKMRKPGIEVFFSE